LFPQNERTFEHPKQESIAEPSSQKCADTLIDLGRNPQRPLRIRIACVLLLSVAWTFCSEQVPDALRNTPSDHASATRTDQVNDAVGDQRNGSTFEVLTIPENDESPHGWRLRSLVGIVDDPLYSGSSRRCDERSTMQSSSRRRRGGSWGDPGERLRLGRSLISASSEYTRESNGECLPSTIWNVMCASTSLEKIWQPRSARVENLEQVHRVIQPRAAVVTDGVRCLSKGSWRTAAADLRREEEWGGRVRRAFLRSSGSPIGMKCI
jgi:hypothetical protein